MTSTAVRVGLRVRPLTHKEQHSNCTECISFIPDQPQILIGKDHSFTYDYVFDHHTEQHTIYETSVVPLVEKFVDGFNATILAYGQTGSGKTYSMGTALEEHIDSEHQGIVPRFIQDLFQRIEQKKETEFQVLVSFLELYNEELLDLLNPQSKKKCEVQIREDVSGNIYWAGVREELCESPEALVKFLVKGSLGRTTGSTDMNSVSSRSHAIFSVILRQKTHQAEGEDPLIVSKFHFVDLAGSERLKRTNAQGDRAREGISINAGLLALGNVISALGDESRRSAHVPYRDSKLTRLLQDSLGGNSQTLMMACVSPSDTNFAETLSTLKYANRARNIKNKVTVNQEFAGSTVQVNQLRSQVARLTLELQSLKSKPALQLGLLGNNEELERLRARVRAMADDVCRLTTERDTLLMERDLAGCEIESSPILTGYQKTIQALRQELADTQDQLAFAHSVQAPLEQTLSPSHNSTITNRRKTNKRRTVGGSTTTTTPKNLHFKSAKRTTKANGKEETQEIDEWIKTTLGSIQTSESSGLRLDARNSISLAKGQIDKALKVLDEFKAIEGKEYECELLADDELFQRLQSDESLLSELDELSSVDTKSTFSLRSRMPSSDTLLTDDSDYSDIQPQYHRMLDQIQSDIQVNESLVSQLERTELEYLEMRKQFECKIYALRDEILALRQSPQKQNMNDVRFAYEGKVKTLMTQLSDLKRKYAQATQNIQASRNQNESTLRALRVNVETLKVEKKRMVKRMKEEAERVKEKLQHHERQIQQLKRKQQKDNDTKRRLEREAKQLQQVVQKKTDESLVTAEKLKSLAGMLKKAVREGGVLDPKLLLANTSLLDLGQLRSSSRRQEPKAKTTTTAVSLPPASVRAAEKKRMLDLALTGYIQNKQAAEELRQLVAKRSELTLKKEEYLSEREHLMQDSDDDKSMLPIDRTFRQVIDENIETVEAEISYINARIHAVNTNVADHLLQDEEIIEQASREKRVTFAHEDADWLDMDSVEEKFSLPAGAGLEQCMETMARILRSVQPDEFKCLIESTIDDIVSLRMEEAHNKMSIQQYEKTTEDLRRTLIVLKRTALDATDDYDRRLKQYQQRRRHSTHSFHSKEESTSDGDSAIDLLPDDNTNHQQHIQSLIHKIYSDCDSRRQLTPSALAEAELSPYLQRRPSLQPQSTKLTGAPMKPSASPLAGRRGSNASPEQFLQQFLQDPCRRLSVQSDGLMLESNSQQSRRRAFSFQQPPTAPSPINQRRRSLLRDMATQHNVLAHRNSSPEVSLDYLHRRSPSNSYELRKSAAHNVFDRLSSGHTQASHAKKKLNSPPSHRYSSSNVDDLRRQWAIELEKIRNGD